MNTTQANKLDALLNLNIKKYNQFPKATLGNVLYVDPNHILMVRVKVNDSEEDAPLHEFKGMDKAVKLNDSVFSYCEKYGSVASFDRKVLIKILDSMDSDAVTIALDRDAPILITGRTGRDEVSVESALAPLIWDSEERLYYKE